MIGKGCAKCSGRNKTSKEFIDEVVKIHGDKYDYSLVEYTKSHQLVEIICPNHGVFKQLAKDHILGKGCSKCAGKNKTTTEFINQANIIHKNKYDYSLVKYSHGRTKYPIICPKHGEFKQCANSHLLGKGCPTCKESTGERDVRYFLNENKIKFVSQNTFPDCKYIQRLQFDFYLPELNICIEYNGIQHYKMLDYFGGEKSFDDSKKRDNIKMKYCSKNNIPLIIIRYDEDITEKLKCLL